MSFDGMTALWVGSALCWAGAASMWGATMLALRRASALLSEVTRSLEMITTAAVTIKPRPDLGPDAVLISGVAPERVQAAMDRARAEAKSAPDGWVRR